MLTFLHPVGHNQRAIIYIWGKNVIIYTKVTEHKSKYIPMENTINSA